jgi:hypothetical protein
MDSPAVSETDERGKEATIPGIQKNLSSPLFGEKRRKREMMRATVKKSTKR